MEFVLIAVLVIVVAVDGANSAPNKFGSSNGGFIPSNLRFHNDLVQGQNMTNSQLVLSGTNKIESKLDKDNHVQRFGVSGYGNTGAGVYSNSGTGISTYQPMKIDIGGVVLGTLIGLGAILIIPKIAHLFSGGYRRSIESEVETITDVLMKIDKSLEEHHIDSSSCIQRIICSHVQESEKNILSGEPTTIDSLIHAVTNNSVISFLMDGTSIKQAVKLGKEKDDPESCGPLYSQCPITKNNIMQVISSILPS